MTKKRIAVLTMHNGDPKLMLSGVADGVIHIAASESLTKNVRALNETLPARLDSYRKKGFIVVVDEVIPNFFKYGRALRLETPTPSGKPVIVEAMQAYETMSRLNAITYPKNSGGSFQISSNVYEETRGGDGKASYRINWQEIKTDVVALLLTLYVATQQSLSDSANLDDFLSRISTPAEDETFNGFAAFNRIIDSTNQQLLSPDALERGRS